MRIPLSSPDIIESDIEAVATLLRTPHLSLGPRLREFEEALAHYIGVPHCVALSSGTAGLHLSLLALGIGEGDEVIIPSFTFVAVANAVLSVRAVPVFADIDAHTLNLDPASVVQAVTVKTRAIVVVHTFGVPADLDPILDIARRYDVRLVEDACEAIGAEYRGRKTGAFGDVGVFSFYPNKPITTGEGGALCTHSDEVARTVRALRNQGRADHDGSGGPALLGYNYRIADINCVLGIEQLKRLERILARREAIAQNYTRLLQAEALVTTPMMTVAGGRVSWFAYVVRLASDRDSILNEMAARGIGCRAYFPAIHRQTLYAKYTRTGLSLAVTEQVASSTLALPFFNELTGGQQEDVCRSLSGVLASNR